VVETRTVGVAGVSLGVAIPVGGVVVMVAAVAAATAATVHGDHCRDDHDPQPVGGEEPDHGCISFVVVLPPRVCRRVGAAIRWGYGITTAVEY